jgi:hypothetical protein
MFCSKCGNKIPDGNAFCGNCGNAVSTSNDIPLLQQKQQENQEGMKQAGKKKMIVTGIAIVVVIIIAIFVINGGGLGSSSGLNGTWEIQNDSLGRSLTFSGKSVSYSRTQQYQSYTHITNMDGKIQEFEEAGYVITDIRGGHYWGDIFVITLIATIKGTFTLTTDEIEFVWENGDIQAHSFSRTDNTIAIGESRYVRIN